MKNRIFFVALAVCLLLTIAACGSNGHTFDPTSVLDPAGETGADDPSLPDEFDVDDRFDGDDDDDDPDADDTCSSDLDGDDDDDDACP